jgi:hypothetical protein
VEKIKTGVLTENELDKLLKESFLELDLKASANVRMLDMVAGHQLRNRGISSFLNAERWNLIVLLFCISACLNSFYTYINNNEELIMQKTRSSFSLSPVNTRQGEKTLAKSLGGADKINIGTSDLFSNKHKNKKEQRTSALKVAVVPIQTEEVEPENIPLEDSSAFTKNDAIQTVQSVGQQTTTVPVKQEMAAPSINRRVTEAKAEPATTKAKKVRKKRRSVFHRNGTFIMKSGKYRKSSRI